MDAPKTLREINAMENQQLHEDFNKLMQETGENGYNNQDQSDKDENVETSSEENIEDDSLENDVPEADNSEPSDEVDNVPQQDEIVPTKPKRGRPSKPNFEEEYNKLMQDKKAKEGLLTSRLNEVSQLYQELKASVEKQAEKSPQYPDNVKEAFELFPELHEAVNYIIDSKVSKIQESIEPLKAKAQQSEKEIVLNKILSAHPDAVTVVQSGELSAWINTLPAVQRTGAQVIYNQGSPEDMIELLNQFKESKGNQYGQRTKPKTNGSLQNSASKSNPKGSPSSYGLNGQTNSNEGEIVNKVLAALNVPSNREQVNLSTNPKVKELGFEDAVREHEEQRKRRQGW